MINFGIKNIISKSFSFLIFNNTPKIIISSSGRCGSTMVFNAVIDGLLIHKLGHTYMRFLGNLTRDIVSVYLKNLSEINNSHFIVHKNHEPYFKKNNNPDKHIYLFIFGDPLDSALSVESFVQKKGLDWFYKHQEHLCGSGSYQDLFKKDILNYENIMHSWINAKEDNILCIDYDDLWWNENTVSDFVGFDVKFPPRLERKRKIKRKINNELFAKLKKKKISLKEQL